MAGGADGYELIGEVAGRDAVLAALVRAGALRVSADAWEGYRITNGMPAIDAEFGLFNNPLEARLLGAISETKGCYTGQEIIARLRSRGRVNHLLVGLRFAEGEMPDLGSALYAAPSAAASAAKPGDRGKRIGEVTSLCVSPDFAAIGLGFVRRECADPGTQVATARGVARVAELPFSLG